MPGRPAATPLDASVDLLGLARTLARRRWTILASVLLFAGLGLAGLMLIAPRYTATARILIDPRQQRVVQNEIVQQGFGPDMALMESQVEVITSEAVLRRVVASADLSSDPEFVKKVETGQDAAVVALEGLAKATVVTRPENTYVLQISVSTKEAAKSARLANAVATAYLAYQSETTADTARGVSTSIRDRLAELEKQLLESEEEVEAFKRENNVAESEGQLLADRRLTDLSARRSAALSRVNETRTRLEVMQGALKSRGDVSAAAVVGAEGAMTMLRTQLAAATRNLAELKQVLGPRHPRVAAAQGEVAQAQATIRAESERLVRAAQDDARAAKDALALVDKELGSAQSASFDTNQNLIRLRELERKAQSSKVVYESFLVRAKETAEQENIAVRNARIIGEAAVPASPAFPPRLPLLAGAVLLGLFFGVPAAIVQDLAAGTLVSRAQRRGAAAAPAEPLPGRSVMVVSLSDLDLARRTALSIAREDQSAGRAVIYVDFAPDAPPDIPGFAEMANGEMAPAKLIEVDDETGLHILNAGRPEALARLPRDQADFVLRAIIGEYDEVVVNAGGLAAAPTALAETVGRSAAKTVLAVGGAKPDRREKRALKALGANAVTLAAPDGRVTQAA